MCINIPFEKNEVVISKSFKIDKGRAFSCLFIKSFFSFVNKTGPYIFRISGTSWDDMGYVIPVINQKSTCMCIVPRYTYLNNTS